MTDLMGRVPVGMTGDKLVALAEQLDCYEAGALKLAGVRHALGDLTEVEYLEVVEELEDRTASDEVRRWAHALGF